MSDVKDLLPVDASGFGSINWSALWTSIADTLFGALIRIAYAVAVLLLGLLAIWAAGKAVRFFLRRAKIDPTLQGWIATVIAGVLKLILLTWVVGVLGIDMLTTAGLLASFGLAVGLALGGVVQNFVAGAIIIAVNPFRTGDWIIGGGFEGRVVEIGMTNTHIKTVDRKVAIVPNLLLVTNSVVNCTREPVRRIDFTMDIAFVQDVAQARDVIIAALKEDPRVLDDPPIQVMVREVGASCVTLIVAPFVKAENIVSIQYAFCELCHAAFKKHGICEPWPATELHLAEDASRPIIGAIEAASSLHPRRPHHQHH